MLVGVPLNWTEHQRTQYWWNLMLKVCLGHFEQKQQRQQQQQTNCYSTTTTSIRGWNNVILKSRRYVILYGSQSRTTITWQGFTVVVHSRVILKNVAIISEILISNGNIYYLYTTVPGVADNILNLWVVHVLNRNKHIFPYKSYEEQRVFGGVNNKKYRNRPVTAQELFQCCPLSMSLNLLVCVRVCLVLFYFIFIFF